MNSVEEPIQMPEINYEELQDPPSLTQDLLNKIDGLIKSTNWTQSHQCVTMLRQINKFFPQHIPDVLNRYSKALLDLFTQGKTQITKNILRFLKEIFDMGQTINVDKGVSEFLPILVKKSATEIGHIKQMSQLVLAAFSSNCAYSKSFEISAVLCCDKNVQVAEISIKLLFILIKNVEGALMQLDPQALSYIMKAMAFLIDGKRQNMKTQALDMCMFMYNVMGGHNYMKLMEYALSPEEMQPMIQGMEYHRINKPKHVPLANLLRQRRTEQFTMKENYNTQNYNQNIQPKNNYY